MQRRGITEESVSFERSEKEQTRAPGGERKARRDAIDVLNGTRKGVRRQAIRELPLARALITLPRPDEESARLNAGHANDLPREARRPGPGRTLLSRFTPSKTDVHRLGQAS